MNMAALAVQTDAPSPIQSVWQAGASKVMTTLKLNDVRILLAEPRVHVRSSLKSALADAGLHNIEDAAKVETVSESVTQAIGPDILICDSGLGGGDVCETVSALRHNEIGRNPFVCIIAITWNPTEGEVDRIINCGVDTIIAAPLSPQQVLDRVDNLVHHRLPFVVTSDYVGPDRRKEPARETTVPVMEAPNTLRAKALGRWDPIAMRREIEYAVGDIKIRKIERQAIDIAGLAAQVLAQSRRPGPDMSKAHLARLHDLLAELDGRAEAESMVHMCELCRTARGLVTTMREYGGAQADKNLQLLLHLSMAIRAAAQPRDGATMLAHDIAQTVNNVR